MIESSIAGYIPSSLSPNIKVIDWLPQNDLLGHKDIKTFVSHVGHNSLYEAAYHGVPVVAFPLFGDQFANAKKAEHFGLGLSVDHRNTNAQQLLETIELVISEPRYQFNLQPTPVRSPRYEERFLVAQSKPIHLKCPVA